MRVIVIIVTYNGMRWYKSCFDSLRDSIIPLETIVIDNKSTDETVRYIKENYPEIHLIEAKENLGFGKANNIGFEYAIEQKADYAFLLNQDAWIQPDTISRLADQMKLAPEFGILSPIHLSGDEDKLDFNFSYYVIDEWCPNLVSDFIVKGKCEDKVYPVKFINAALWLISRECLEAIGGFDPVYPHYGEDINYVDRLEYHGYRIGIYPRVFGVHDRMRNMHRVPSSQQVKNKEIALLLVSLTNPRESFILSTFRTFFDYTTKSLFKNLFRLSIKGVCLNLNVMMSIFCLLPQIRRNRNIGKIKGLSFLK